MVMPTHTKDTTAIQQSMARETVIDMDMQANRHPVVHKVGVAIQIVHNVKLKAVDTMIEPIPRIISTTRVTHNLMMTGNTMNHNRHEVLGGAVRHIICQICLTARSHQ